MVMDKVLLFIDYLIVFMCYQIVFMCYQEDDNGLWTISKMFMFYGLQYNEDFTRKKASLYFIYFIL